MNKFFEHKTSFKDMEFCHSLKPTVDEREIHTYHEILFYIGGGATFICNDYSKKLDEGTLIFIPKECYHFFSTDEPEKFERFKITIPHSALDDQMHDVLPQDISLIEHLDPTAYKTVENALEMLERENEPARAPYLYGTAFILLSLFSTCGNDIGDKNRDRTISEVLRIIDFSLTEKIDVQTLAEHFFVSPSTLTHTFKREMGISLHRYVTQKRLIEAAKLIAQGDDPTKIYTLFGYSDYSSFYKAYRKFFGYSPSSTALIKLPKI